jgi:cytochrome bd-type quinol oxidase subunit 2
MSVAADPIRSGRLPGARLAVAGGVIGATTDAFYLGLIAAQGERTWARVGFVALFLSAVAAGAVVGGLSHGRTSAQRVNLLAASAGGFLTAGVLALLSIGVLLLVAGVLTGAAWILAAGEASEASLGMRLGSILAFLAAGGVLIVGIALT